MQGGENWPYTTEFHVRICDRLYYQHGFLVIRLLWQSTSDASVSTESYVGPYRMHRFRSCYTPIKGLTADILVSVFVCCDRVLNILQITAAEIAYNRKTSYERFAPTQTDPVLGISLLPGRNEESPEARP